MTQKTIAIQAKRVLADKSPATVAHQFGFSRVGTDLVFEVGHFDITELSTQLNAAQRDGRETVAAELIVSHRFSLTPQAALSLLETAQKMMMDLQNAGMVKIGAQPTLPVKTAGMD